MPPTDPIPPMYLSRDQAAQASGVCARTIDAAIAAGELVAYRVGRRVLIRPEAIWEWIERPQKKETALAGAAIQGGNER